MADLQSTVAIIFRGEDRVGPAAQSALGSIAALGAGLKGATEPLADLTKGALALELALVSMAVALGTKAYQAAVDFESSVIELRKVFDGTDAQLTGFTTRVIDLALETGKSSNDLVESMANFVQAGFSAEEAAGLVEDSLRLMVAGNVDAAQASELIIASLKGFGLGAENTAGIIDLLNEVSNKYATNLEELGIGFSELSPIAKIAGLSLQETAGLLTPAIEVFRSGSESAQAFKTILTRLADPTPEIAENLAKLGVATTDVNGNLRSVRDILFDVAGAFQNVDQAQQLQLASILAGKEQAGKFAAVMTDFNKVLEISGSRFEFAGSAQREYEERLKSSQVVIDKFKTAIDELLASIGEEYRKNMNGVVGATGNLALAFREVVESGGPLEPLFQFIRDNLDQLAKAIETVAKNLPEALAKVDFTNLLDSFGELKGVVLGFLDGEDLTSVDGLAKVLQLVADGIASLTRFSAGAVESFGPLVDKITLLVTTFRDLDPELIKTLGSFGGFATQINAALPAVDTLLLAMIALAGAKGTGLLAGAAAGFASLGAALVHPVTLMGTFAFLLTRLSGADKTLNDWLAPDWLAGYKDATLGTAVADLFEQLGILNSTAEDSVVVMTKVNDVVAQIPTGIASIPETMEKATTSFKGFSNELDAFHEKLDAATFSSQDLKNELAAFGDSLLGDIKLSDTGIDEDIERLAAGLLGVQENAQGYFEVIDENGVRSFSNLSTAIGDAGRAVNDANFSGQGELFTGFTKKVVEFGDKTVTVYEQVGGAGTEAGRKQKEALDKTRQATDAALKKSVEYQIKMEEIASNERIKTIEATVTLNVARLEADTERVKAAFESINTTIDSTGELIGSLFGTLADLDRFEQLAVFDQIAKENERRDAALKDQHDLVQKKIEALEAYASTLRSDKPLIRVDGTGMEPEIKAVMWAMIRNMHIEAAASFPDFLIGLNPALSAAA